mgnify:CR=1 FL=1
MVSASNRALMPKAAGPPIRSVRRGVCDVSIRMTSCPGLEGSGTTPAVFANGLFGTRSSPPPTLEARAPSAEIETTTSAARTESHAAVRAGARKQVQSKRVSESGSVQGPALDAPRPGGVVETPSGLGIARPTTRAAHGFCLFSCWPGHRCLLAKRRAGGWLPVAAADTSSSRAERETSQAEPHQQGRRRLGDDGGDGASDRAGDERSAGDALRDVLTCG